MARTKNENKEAEEIKEEVVTETTEKVEEPKTEEITSTGEPVEAPAEEAKVEENAFNEKQEAEVQVTNEVEKVPTVKEIFRDKYDGRIIYNVGDTFILDEKLKDNKPVKVKDKQYKVSKERYEELQRSLYVD